jgi:hypothetical protein
MVKRWVWRAALGCAALLAGCSEPMDLQVRSASPPVAGFIDAVFEQLAQGKTTCTYQSSETLNNVGQDVFETIFSRMNATL